MDRLTCQTTITDCDRKAVATGRFGPCPDCGKSNVVSYCQRHYDRVAEKGAGETWRCRMCGGSTPFGLRTPYEIAREAWLDHGYLADKDKMVDAVTLTEPAGWDVYGSIMYDPPKAPARWSPPVMTLAGLVAVIGFIIMFAVLMA